MVFAIDLITNEPLIETFDPIIPPKYPDDIGKTFGRLTILYQTDTPYDLKSKGIYYFCRCKCGNIKITSRDSLKYNNTKSCGCLAKEKAKLSYKFKGLKKLTLRRRSLKNCWRNMINRCYDENNKKYKRYGARGITVCDEWKNDFELFYKWAINNGYKYYKNKKKLLTLDRINNDGNYEPLNCRWLTRKEQNRNTSRNIYFIINGQTKLLQDLVNEYNMSHRTILRKCISGEIKYEYCNIDIQDKLDFYNKKGKYKK